MAGRRQTGSELHQTFTRKSNRVGSIHKISQPGRIALRWPPTNLQCSLLQPPFGTRPLTTRPPAGPTLPAGRERTVSKSLNKRRLAVALQRPQQEPSPVLRTKRACTPLYALAHSTITLDRYFVALLSPGGGCSTQRVIVRAMLCAAAATLVFALTFNFGPSVMKVRSPPAHPPQSCPPANVNFTHPLLTGARTSCPPNQHSRTSLHTRVHRLVLGRGSCSCLPTR